MSQETLATIWFILIFVLLGGSVGLLASAISLAVCWWCFGIVNGVAVSASWSRASEAAHPRTERDIRVAIDSGDELEVLGAAFNKMVADIADANSRFRDAERPI
jgi:nitrate/nitrite-specific signal transduction histidine kinase